LLLEIRCQNGSTYTFGSKDKRDAQVLEIKPSRCWPVGAEFADQDGILRKQLPAEPKMQRPLDFAAGRAHYIGDYFAKGDYSFHPGVIAVRHWDWDMTSAAGDRYEATTAEMKQAFPNLAPFPTDHLRLIAATERKRGNGIGASPGEPPLSPARVAGLAPFIGRSYATPAQCETACPTGQCLPYRGESGPAMPPDAAAGAGDQRDLPCNPEIHARVIPPRRPGRGRGSGTMTVLASTLDAESREPVGDRVARRRFAEEIARKHGVDPGDVEHVLANLTLPPVERLRRSIRRARLGRSAPK
jgi:hypothetical protein